MVCTYLWVICRKCLAPGHTPRDDPSERLLTRVPAYHLRGKALALPLSIMSRFQTRHIEQFGISYAHPKSRARRGLRFFAGPRSWALCS
jgi:hypothetical protein